MGFLLNLKRYLFIYLCYIPFVLGLNVEEFGKYVEKSFAEWGVAGGAIAIVENGKVTYIKCYGVEEVGSANPVTEDSSFALSSLSKAFTALLLVKLHDQKILDLNRPVISYLSDFQLNDSTVTQNFNVLDLMIHNSGLPQFSFDSLVETGGSENEIYQLLPKIPFTYKFREGHGYQNIFPGIAGMLLKKVTGLPLSTLYENEIFKPLGMTHTYIGKRGLTGGEAFWKKVHYKIKGWFRHEVGEHYRVNGKPVKIPGGNPGLYTFPSTRGIRSTIKDMSRWLVFWQTHKDINGNPFLSPEKMKIFFEPHSTSRPPKDESALFPMSRVSRVQYGLGWYLQDHGPLKEVYTHAGAMTGNRAFIIYVPEKKIGMVILCNVGGMRVNQVPEALRSRFLDEVGEVEDKRDWSKLFLESWNMQQEAYKESLDRIRRENPQGPRRFSLYAGTFTHPLYGALSVKVINQSGQEKLSIHYKKLSVTLNHWNGDLFIFDPSEFSRSYAPTDHGIVQFSVDAQGQAQELIFSSLTELESKFKRVL